MDNIEGIYGQEYIVFEHAYPVIIESRVYYSTKIKQFLVVEKWPTDIVGMYGTFQEIYEYILRICKKSKKKSHYNLTYNYNPAASDAYKKKIHKACDFKKAADLKKLLLFLI